MPTGQIIGRVAVRVLPNTDDFRKETKRKLAAIEKNLKFVVPTRLDVTGAKRDMLLVLREVNAENKRMDSRKIRFTAKLSHEGMLGELASYRRAFNVLAKTRPVKIKATLVAASAELQLDTDSLNKVKRQLDRWRRGMDPLEVNVKAVLAEASMLATRSRLALLARSRFVTFVPRVSKAAVAKVGALLAALSGARMLSSTFANIWDMFKNLDKVIPLIAAIGSGVGLLATSLLTASSNAFALIASLASIAGLGLAMPGILGAFAVGLGVTATAFTTFADNVPDVRKALTELKKQIGRDFWKEAADPVREMANELLPRLGKSAKTMGTYFGGLFDALSGAFKRTLVPMFRDFNESVRIATGGTDGFAGVITKLGILGSSYLPRLATWFVKITDQFDSFLAKAGADGRLQAWVDNGIIALRDLGNVMKGMFNVFTDLGRAAKAAGGSTLGTLADSLERLHKVTSGKVFQTGMAKAFRAAHEAISLIVDKSGPAVSAFFLTFSDTLTELLPIIGSTIGTALGALADALGRPEFQKGLVAMFAGIQKGIDGLAPVLPSLGDALGKVGEIIGTLATSFGPLLARALQVAVDVFMALEPALTPLIPILGDALLAVIDALAPSLVALTEALSPVIVALGTALASAVITLAPHLATIAGLFATTLVEALDVITPYIPELVQGFTDMLVALVPLIPEIVTLAREFLPLLKVLTEAAVVGLPGFIKALELTISFVGILITGITGMVAVWSTAFGGMLRIAATVAEKLHLPTAGALRTMSDDFDTTTAQIRTDLESIATTATASGAATGANFSAGVAKTAPSILTAAGLLSWNAQQALRLNAEPIGVGIGESLAKGLASTVPQMLTAAGKVAYAAKAELESYLNTAAPNITPSMPRSPALPRSQPTNPASANPFAPANPFTPGTSITIGTVQAHDYKDFTEQMNRKQRQAAMGGT